MLLLRCDHGKSFFLYTINTLTVLLLNLILSKLEILKSILLSFLRHWPWHRPHCASFNCFADLVRKIDFGMCLQFRINLRIINISWLLNVKKWQKFIIFKMLYKCHLKKYKKCKSRFHSFIYLERLGFLLKAVHLKVFWSMSPFHCLDVTTQPKEPESFLAIYAANCHHRP